MKYSVAAQTQRTRRIRNQEAMHRSHRRSELIRQASTQEDQTLPFAPVDDVSVEPASSLSPDKQNASSTSDERSRG